MLLLASVIFANCSKSNQTPDQTPDSHLEIPKLIVGEWVYDAPEIDRWETVKFLSNMSFSYSVFVQQPYISLDAAPGSYSFTTADSKHIYVTYYNINGQTNYQDLEVKSIKKYEMMLEFTSDVGAYVGEFTYNKLVKKIDLNIRDTESLDYALLLGDVGIKGFSTKNSDKIKVDAQTGSITVLDKTGLAYVYIDTDDGVAAVQITITDPDNLFPDYTNAFLMTPNQIRETWGKYNTEYANAIFYPLHGNNYASAVKIILNQDNSVDYIQVDLKNPISQSSHENAINDFLNSKYDFYYIDNGWYVYFDHSRPFTLPLLVCYSPTLNIVQYLVISAE